MWTKERPEQALPGEQLAQGEAWRLIAEEEESKERNGDQLALGMPILMAT